MTLDNTGFCLRVKPTISYWNTHVKLEIGIEFHSFTFHLDTRLVESSILLVEPFFIIFYIGHNHIHKSIFYSHKQLLLVDHFRPR